MNLRNNSAAVSKIAGMSFGVLLLLSAAVPSARAAAVTSFTDTLSMVRTAAPANHTLSFVAANNIAEGQTLTVTWATAFDATGMTEDDIDVSDDGTQLTTAPDCSGTEAIGATFVGNVLTLTICAGDGGAVALGSTIVIKVGTRAVNSGMGVNRIINPATVGSHLIVLGGTAGTSGVAAVAIVAQDTIDVTARVEPHNPPGGSTGSGQTPGPRVSNVVIDQITASTARVSWRTDIISNSYVLYGLTASYGAIRGTDDLVLDHEALLMGLAPDYIYHVQARSVDQFGTVGTSADQTFSTLKAAVGNPPQILNIRLESVTAYEAQILWQTDQPTYSRVEFGKTASYGSVVETAQFSVDHRATLGNLSPATVYHYRIIAIDENGGQTISPDQTFSTFDTLAPRILNIHTENLTSRSFDIAWSTDKPATGGVKYGQTPAYEGGEVIEANGFVTSHRVALSYLASNTVYHYKIFQSDQFGNEAESADQTATTLSDLSPPANPRSFAAVPGDKSVSLSWKNPPEDDLGKMIIRRKTGDYPDSIFDGVKVYEGTGTNKIDTNLNNGTTYYYRIFSVDRSGNASTGSVARAIPAAKPTVVPPSPIVPSEAPLTSTVFGSSRIILTIDGVPFSIHGDLMTILLDSRVHVELPPELTERPIKNAFLRIGDEIYEFMVNKNGAYYTDIISPSAIGRTLGIIMITRQDGSTEYSKWTINTLALGKVFELTNGMRAPVEKATVTIFEGNKPWDGSRYGQQNPQITEKDGSYRLFVPKGIYHLLITKPNYNKFVGRSAEYSGPVTDNIGLERAILSYESVKKAQNLLKNSVNSILELIPRRPIVTFSILLPLLLILVIINRLTKRKKQPPQP